MRVFLQLDIARANGARVFRNISAHGNPQTPLNVELPNGEYSLTYSLYSPNQQISGKPCSIRTADDFKATTWEKVLQWCNLKFQDLRGLASPFVWIEGSQTAMYPPSQPVNKAIFHCDASHLLIFLEGIFQHMLLGVTVCVMHPTGYTSRFLPK